MPRKLLPQESVPHETSPIRLVCNEQTRLLTPMAVARGPLPHRFGPLRVRNDGGCHVGSVNGGPCWPATRCRRRNATAEEGLQIFRRGQTTQQQSSGRVTGGVIDPHLLLTVQFFSELSATASNYCALFSDSAVPGPPLFSRI